MTERIYLDWNATAPLRPQARAALTAALEVVGNPSSVHAAGRAARRLVEEARAAVAALLGAAPRDVVFTSGGTEANALALSPTNAGERLLMSAIEHPSVLSGGRFPASAIETIPVTPDGVIDLDALASRLAACGGKALLSVMLANNETGVLQPISQVAALVHQAGARLHVDAVQGAGRIPCDINALEADLLTVSGHKFGGPRGVGALIARSRALEGVAPVIRGGGQERGLRAGTENVAGIAGFGAAAAAASAALAAEGTATAWLRDRLEAALLAAEPRAVIFGRGAPRLPNTTLFAVPGVKAETAVIALDLAGVEVSSGAACSSGKVQASHVLAAMGVAPALARGAIRVSLGPQTPESAVEGFIAAWIKVSEPLLRKGEGIAA